jgi:ketosteroid isomerase-like protein
MAGTDDIPATGDIPATEATDAVRAVFRAYLAGDREAAERLLADGFVFTSPRDDHIDRAAWFERCFPTAGRFTSYELLDVVDVGGGRVFARYEYGLGSGERYRNAEFLTVRDGRLTETEVFFGGRVPRPGGVAGTA